MPCDNGSFCLGANDTGRQCCAQDQGFFIADGKATRTKPNATNSASASIGIKVGIGLGVGLGVIAILALVGFLVLRRRRRGSPEEEEEEETPEMTQAYGQHTSDYDASLAPPNTEIYSMGDYYAESVEIDSRTFETGPNRQSYTTYGASGRQEDPVELPSERTPSKHEHSVSE